RLPTLWRAIPVFERLQTAWEKKQKDARFALYAPGLDKALKKLRKYYCAFDNKPVFVLAVFLHPYFKMDYIVKAWGGLEEQMQEIADGDRRAKNWKAEAERIVHDAVHFIYSLRY
ncbi:hypothetical protein SISNIDRAFT_395834, partial [Sistotremastrum niveocremeum HHB9708]